MDGPAEEGGCCWEEATGPWELASPSWFAIAEGALSGCGCEESASVAIFGGLWCAKFCIGIRSEERYVHLACEML